MTEGVTEASRHTCDEGVGDVLDDGQQLARWHQVMTGLDGTAKPTRSHVTLRFVMNMPVAAA